MKKPNRKAANHLAAWLTDERSDAYFGDSFVVKFEIGIAIASKSAEPVSDIARRHGISPQAANKHARRFRKLFNLTPRSP